MCTFIYYLSILTLSCWTFCSLPTANQSRDHIKYYWLLSIYGFFIDPLKIPDSHLTYETKKYNPRGIPGSRSAETSSEAVDLRWIADQSPCSRYVCQGSIITQYRERNTRWGTKKSGLYCPCAATDSWQQSPFPSPYRLGGMLS